MTTLKASSDKLVALIDYYAGLAEDRARPGLGRGPVDYYLDPDEPAGRWWGSGLDALGLAGEVHGEQLRSLLAATDPRTGWPLGRSFGEKSARGFDATFSAPKSVSALWALTPDRWVRAEVLAAHDAAVTAALGWFEDHGAVTRRGTDGVDQVDSQGIAAALFRQHTSRTMDPQLHTHAVISSKVQDETGKWLALDARFLKYQQRTIGWIYDAALRSELTTRLGVTWQTVESGPVDLDCIPDEVRGVLSKRTGQVDEKLGELLERWMDENDGADPDPATIAYLERKAVLASRPSKTHGIDAPSLHQDWTAQAAEVGFDPDTLTPERIRQHQPASPVDGMGLIEEAIRRVSEESSTWLEADLARHLATMLPTDTGLDAQGLVDRIDELAETAVSYCRDISPVPSWGPCRQDGRPIGEHVTDHRLTTGHILEQEQDLQDWAQATTTTPPATDDPRPPPPKPSPAPTNWS
ncbi:MAG TPA: MobF family relaxase [Acidimicrobiales bacterium]|nr:MobF family relaxase [Acidimicrobiales bacterium]